MYMTVTLHFIHIYRFNGQ